MFTTRAIHWFSGKDLLSLTVRGERLEDVREALINCDTQFLQLGNVQKREKVLQQKIQVSQIMSRVGVVKSSPSSLGCSQAPKLPCASPQVSANYSTRQGMQSEMSARFGHSIHTTILHLASANLNAQKDLKAYQIREICLLSQNPAFSTLESGIQ